MFYYGIDIRTVVRGQLDPAFVLSLVARLPEDSMTRSMIKAEKYPDYPEAWRLFMDNGPLHYRLGHIYDAVNQQTAVTGNWKKRPPTFDPYPTPEVVLAEARAKRDKLASKMPSARGQRVRNWLKQKVGRNG